MVEDVEVFPAEFKGVLLFNRESFEETEVEVQSTREVQPIAPEVTNCQPNRLSESIGIIVENPECACVRGTLGCGYSIWIRDQVRKCRDGATDTIRQPVRCLGRRNCRWKA